MIGSILYNMKWDLLLSVYRSYLEYITIVGENCESNILDKDRIFVSLLVDFI